MPRDRSVLYEGVDLADQTRVVQALRHTEHVLHDLIESSIKPIAILDETGTILYANPAYQDCFGRSPASITGRSMDVLLYPGEIASFRNQLARAAANTDQAVPVRCRIAHADGSWHRFEGTVRSLRDDPPLRRLLLSGRDLTAPAPDPELRRMLAARLHVLHGIDQATLDLKPAATLVTAALDGLRQLTDSALAVALLWDFDAHVVKVVAASTEDAERWGPMTDLPMEDFSLPSVFLEHRTIHVEDLAQLESPTAIVRRARDAGMSTLLTETLSSRGEFFGVLTLCAAEPAAFDHAHRAMARQVADQLAIALLQVRLREQLQAQAQALEARVHERTEQLEAANKELETFSYSVSHDLRNPLQMISGFSELLKNEIAGTSSAAAADYMERIQSNVRRTEELITALLRLSRVARMQLLWESVDLGRLVEAAVADQRRLDPEREVEFVMTSGAIVDGDVQLLSIVMENLISNAWKYTSRHPSARVEFGTVQQGGTTVYFVRDDGAGFDMEHTAKLFAPFHRLHRDDEFEGTGIGLATVQRILRRHNGRVWAEAAVEKGATFYFTVGEAR